MAGEHILKLMDTTSVRLAYKDRHMYFAEGTFTIFKDKKNSILHTVLANTKYEIEACEILLKGEEIGEEA